jgi:putative transposase
VGLRSDGLLTPHAIYWGLGNTPYAREAAYRERVLAGLLQDQHDQLMQATLKGWVLGAPEFVAQLQNQTSRRLSPGERGRPRLVAQNPSD